MGGEGISIIITISLRLVKKERQDMMGLITGKVGNSYLAFRDGRCHIGRPGRLVGGLRDCKKQFLEQLGL